MEKNFNKEKFALVLKNISTIYDNQRDFALKASINRTYISRYINLSVENPPTPKILKKIAEASQGKTTYEDLMYICGYTDTKTFSNKLVDNSIAVLPLLISLNGSLIQKDDLWISKKILKQNVSYYGYKTTDNSMSPLLGEGDIAIVEKTETFENGNTCLISLDNSIIFVRKILDFKDYIELHTIIPYNQPIKLTNEDIKNRNFKILGKVIKVENESAFK